MLVEELMRYRISVAEVQETKWCGSDVWPVADGYITLHSGSLHWWMVLMWLGGLSLNSRATGAWQMANKV